MTPHRPKRIQRGLVWLAAGAATLGVGLGAAGLASAASSSGSSTSSTAAVTADTSNSGSSTSGTAATPPADAPADPASLPNGPGETLLTGDTLAKVTAAAQAAQPGATVIRAETDSGGHAYEVHMQLADGTFTTLYFDASFAADGSDTGFGGGPGGPGHQGQPPVAPAGTTATAGA